MVQSSCVRLGPMILGIGIDILQLARLQSVISRRGGAALATRICSAREIQAFSELAATVDEPEAVIAEERFLASRYAFYSFKIY